MRKEYHTIITFQFSSLVTLLFVCENFLYPQIVLEYTGGGKCYILSRYIHPDK